MSFRFNFGSESNHESDDKSSAEVSSSDEIQWLDSQEVIPNRQLKELDSMVGKARMFTCGEVEIGHVMVSDAISNMTKNSPDIASTLADDANSDLITGKYEGGLKIWECTHDLIQYLIEHEDTIQFQDKKVLDLGCGAGILGIYAFLKGASVTFQDYNIEVVEYITIPNVLLNIEEEEEREQILEKCSFFSGDWALFNKKLEANVMYDFILTSETIYNEINYDKLVTLFKQRLADDGIIYVAAKTCYFGVGGGVRQFEKYINLNNLFRCQTCWTNTSGIQREILKITKKV